MGDNLRVVAHDFLPAVTSCLSACPRSKRKTAELSTPNLVHKFSIAGTRPALTLRSKVKGQAHAVIDCAAGVGTQVDMTTEVSSCKFVT